MKEFPVKYRGEVYLVQVDDDDALRIEAALNEAQPEKNSRGHVNVWLYRKRSLSYVPAWKNRGFRPAIWTGGKLWYLSRWILGVTDSKQIVDHIDQNPLNNQRSNLRVVGRRENAYNSGKMGWRKGKSKYRGVNYIKSYKSKPWSITKIYPDGSKTSEYFATEDEAYLAREKWLLELAKLLKMNFEAKGNRQEDIK